MSHRVVNRVDNECVPHQGDHKGPFPLILIHSRPYNDYGIAS
jgi:hypothetical protein